MSGGERRLFLDLAAGETRGVVLLDGAPERLLIERPGAAQVQAAGARAVGRVRRIERGLEAAFVDLGEGSEALLGLTGAAARLREGQAVEVQIAAPARRGKGALLRLIGPAEGPPRLLAPGPNLADRLSALAPGEAVTRGRQAREAADLAEAEALAVEHPLGGGASLSIEPTRALVAIDVDVGAALGASRRAGEARVNRLAIAVAARLLRLKGLGGLVVFDLAGGVQDGTAILEAAKTAFAPDMPGVVFGPTTRLGTFQLALPWRATPVAELLNGEDGRPTPETVARRLARAMEAEAAHCTRVRGICAPEVAAAFEAVAPALVERLGARFDIQADTARSRDDYETRPHD